MDRRSECPISFALEIFGDRWTLLVLRDLAMTSKCSFQDLLHSGEGIATNVLSDRLSRLEEQGLIKKERDPNDGRRFQYSPTKAGLDLVPVLLEMIIWSGKHDPDTHVSKSFLRRAKSDREAVVSELKLRRGRKEG